MVRYSDDSEQHDGYHHIVAKTVVGELAIDEQTGLQRTNIATHHFTNLERLMFAISDDDVSTIERLAIPLEDLVKLEFENNANILNFAIDQERVAIVVHLAYMTRHRPEIRRKLLEHRFRQDEICAVHQVMTIGNRALIDALLINFSADLSLTTLKKLTVMHCAA